MTAEQEPQPIIEIDLAAMRTRVNFHQALILEIEEEIANLEDQISLQPRGRGRRAKTREEIKRDQLSRTAELIEARGRGLEEVYLMFHGSIQGDAQRPFSVEDYRAELVGHPSRLRRPHEETLAERLIVKAVRDFGSMAIERLLFPPFNQSYVPLFPRRITEPSDSRE